ncbi:hypothetical protein E2C01_100770 [Portunus trituberculatus]|uniref:Uncharacterized protein n=1 Tax=Portunus trituberculatus TaxID=210409 RepID=A0A5B7KIR9_PORTR|nr:hypothetical protein [Portunus trituberculatus]
MAGGKNTNTEEVVYILKRQTSLHKGHNACRSRHLRGREAEGGKERERGRERGSVDKGQAMKKEL